MSATAESHSDFSERLHSDSPTRPDEVLPRMPNALAELMRDSEPGERRLLVRELEKVVLSYLEAGESVYLERFGILFPRTTLQSKTYTWEDRWVIRNETHRSIHLEKCVDLTSFHGERYGITKQVIDLGALAARLYPRLPLTLHIRWSEVRFKARLRGVVELVRWDVVTRGYSDLFPNIGTLYALHNRQGTSFEDWFAGCDLFLETRELECLLVGPCRFMPRPTLAESWELFEAHFGAPLKTVECNPIDELRSLGYGDADFEGISDDVLPFKIASFRPTEAEDGPLLVCSDGLRKLGLSAGSPFGTEVVFQLESSTDSPEWVSRVFALAWLALNTMTGKVLSGAKVFSSDTPLGHGRKRALMHLLACNLELVKAPQLTAEGEFRFVNLVGITDEECDVAGRYAPSFLLDLLRARGLDQVTKLDRRCVLARTGLLTSSDGESRKSSRSGAVAISA